VTTFIDASTLTAVLGFETDARAFAQRIADADNPCTSAIAIWEAVKAVCRLRAIDSDRAHRELLAIIARRGINIVPIGATEAVEALIAHDRFGKGNHPAKLNMGDCFAYACAKTNNARLLYKGDDFALTDLA
jgi:ribonuclease VapC